MSIENNTEIYLGKYINEMGHESIKFFIGLQLKVESLLLLVIIFLREESEIIYLQILECHKSHPLKKHETKQRTEE